MDIFINYLIKNKEWIFSGLGIFVIGGNYFFNKNINKSSQKSNPKIYETN